MPRISYSVTSKNRIDSFNKTIEVDSDKSISIRAFLIGSISQGISNLKNVLESEDVFSTIQCLKKLGVKIKKIKNPRIESEKHYYNASNLKMKKRGLKPTLLTDEVIIDLAMFIKKHIKNINKKIIQPKASW